MGALITFFKEHWEARLRDIEERQLPPDWDEMGPNERKVWEICQQPDPEPCEPRYDWDSNYPYLLPEYRAKRKQTNRRA